MGFDQSTDNLAFSIFEDDKLITYKFIELKKKFKNMDIIERITLVKNIMEKYIDKYEVSFVGLEDIFLTIIGGRANGYESFKGLAKLLGALETSLHEKNILYQIIKASEWRKTCKIKGRKREEQKANAIKFVKEKFNINANEDEADAICIGFHTATKLVPKIKIMED